MRLGTGMASPIFEKSRTSRTCISRSFRFEKNSGAALIGKAGLRYESEPDDSTKLAALRDVVRPCDRTRCVCVRPMEFTLLTARQRLTTVRQAQKAEPEHRPSPSRRGMF